jgi:arylsulfatase A-like enzyme
MNRRELLSLLGAGLAWTLFPAGCDTSPPAPAREARHPDIRHVILIALDTTRADHLACYGHPFIETPNIDRLAAEGILFEQHISAASTTLCSFTSLMTGTWPHTHGVPRNGFTIDTGNRMMAEVLQAAGFATAGIIGALPLDRTFNFDQGFDHFDRDYEFIVREAEQIHQAQRRADNVTDAALAWLAANRAERQFLFVHYWDPHLPYDAPEPFGGRYREPGVAYDPGMEKVGAARQVLRGTAPEQHKARVAALYTSEYGAEISYTDHQIGRLVAGLEGRGLLENSLVILTADHGETLQEHENKIQHGKSVYDTEIRTPLILRFPGGRNGGRRTDHLVSNIDLLPTLVDLLGLDREDGVEGRSFAGIVDGELPPRAPVFAEATQPWWNETFDNDPLWANRGKFQCVRTARYKYMFRLPDRKFGLFDLRTDPHEQRNLLLGPHDEAMARSMRQQLEQWRDDVRLQGKPEFTESFDVIEGLRNLGYVAEG